MDETLRSRGVRQAAALLLALALVAVGCSKSSDRAAGQDAPAEATTTTLEPDDPPQRGGRLVFGIPAETDGWNPALNRWADAGNFVGSTMLEPLAAFDEDGVAQPWLAQSIEPVEGSDLKAWRVVLRPDVRFHDGTPLDAAAVARSLTFQYSDPRALTSIALGELFEGAEATGPLELEVRFAEPWAAFPSSMGGPAGYVMAPAMLDSPNLGVDRPVGTGPFRFERWERDRNLLVVRNDDYWRADDHPHLDEIEFRVLKDGKDRAQGLATREIDIMLTTRPDDVTRLEEDGFTVVRDYQTEKTFVMLSAAQGPFANEHARKAVAYATDRDAIAARLGPEVNLSSSPLIAGTPFSIDDADAGYVTYDPVRAAEEIERYKADTGADALRFAFSGLANIEDQAIMQILQEQWRQVGIEASIDTLDQTAYIVKVVTGGFEAAYFRNYAYPDPDSMWVFWHSSTSRELGTLSINFSHWHSPATDELLDEARATLDVEERRTRYHELVRLRNEAAIDVWLFDTPMALVANPRVRGLNGFRTHSFANFLAKPWVSDLWIEQ